jgi:sec-independent protein translocase protein TatB
MPDVFFILLLALVLLGPKKLPQMAAQAGKYVAQFQRMRRELLDQVTSEVGRLETSQAKQITSSIPAQRKLSPGCKTETERTLSPELGSR